MTNRLEFQAASEKIVADLFAGSVHGPARRRVKVKQQRRKEPAVVEQIKPKGKPAHYTRIPCPCCSQTVDTPSLEIVVEHYGLRPAEARVLSAIWRGKGMPVQAERIFDVMYADDPDGGPSPSRMYSAFKVALCHIRQRLKGSGISIVNVGYRQGYRLILGEK